MKKTMTLAAVLGIALSGLVVGGGHVVTRDHSPRHEVALPGDGPIWNTIGNGTVTFEDITGHADGSPKQQK